MHKLFINLSFKKIIKSYHEYNYLSLIMNQTNYILSVKQLCALKFYVGTFCESNKY